MRVLTNLRPILWVFSYDPKRSAMFSVLNDHGAWVWSRATQYEHPLNYLADSSYYCTPTFFLYEAA
jgi:hypothetical protein